jgi:glycosyltransferase involved in cell wall biosynthesis
VRLTRPVSVRAPRCDIAIYMPQAIGLYQRDGGRTGGAERQTYLLARALAERGLRVSYVLYPAHDPAPGNWEGLEVVHRAARGPIVDEPRRIWQALYRADARVYVLRTATPGLGISALYCRARGRRLIYCGASDGDFTGEALERRYRPLYALGIKLADAVVVQSATQAELARRRFPSIAQPVEIPSFVESDGPGPALEPAAFLWVGRLVDNKQPLRYLDLAAALPEARFRMIGVAHAATPAMAALVRRRAAELPNVELLDPRPHAALMPLVGEAVAVVSTSRFEGMPNVFLEAWARGVPALSLDCDPDGRIATQGLGIAARGSWTCFVEGARTLWSDRARRDRYGEAAATFLAHVHSRERVTARWLEVVEPLLWARLRSSYG